MIGENGLIARAEGAQDTHKQGKEKEENGLGYYEEYIGNYESGNGGDSGGGNTPTPEDKPLVSTITTTEHDTIIGEDDKGNQVVIPGGFKIAEGSGTTVQDGIVIEDESGNQFVWIPVSNIDHGGSNKIKIEKDGVESDVEITLGRYTFARTQNTDTGLYEDGTPTKVQYGSEYAATTLEKVLAKEVASYGISNNYELTEFMESDALIRGKNTTAKDLEKFITSVSSNKGYYIARYEASYASGSEFGEGNDSKYYKPASKKSKNKSEDAMNYVAGRLWNNIAQGNAATACRQMYYGNSYVESDLVNSYAWDTAIVYIQAMGNANYANAYDGNGELRNTGETGDEKCKIFDMSANLVEWTTEYFSSTDKFGKYTTVIFGTYRGGGYSSRDYTSYREGSKIYDGFEYSFRPLLYVK